MDKYQPPQFHPTSISNNPLRKDVVGVAGEFIDDFILAMDSEEIYRKMAVDPDKTFLITGKPGTGKTMGIDALLNEANKDVYRSLVSGNLKARPSLIGMDYDIGKHGTAYINMGSKIIQSFFDMCFALSYKQKVLITFDEAEVLFGNRRVNMSHAEDKKVLNTIMKNMQVVHDTPNMYVVMMSNFPDAFDDASIRAGRIDKRYKLQLPNELERKVAYDHTIGKINNKAGYEVIRSYDTFELSKITDGYSYADISESVKAAVKNRATEIARNRRDKCITAGYISQKRLEDAVNEHTNSFISSKIKIGFT